MNRTLEAVCHNRPVKIAYIFNNNENEESHLILNAIISDCVTRWCGGLSLFVECIDGELSQAKIEWMKYYDPDYIYCYSELSQDKRDTVYDVCQPIALCFHDLSRTGDSRHRVDWGSIPRPLCSASLLSSPLFDSGKVKQTVLNVWKPFDDTFVIDNIGLSIEPQGRFPSGMEGLYDSKVLAIGGLPDIYNVESENVITDRAVFAREAFASRSISPLQLSLVESSSVFSFYNGRHANVPCLIIGDTVGDRVDAWNIRLFYEDYSRSRQSIRVSISDLDDSGLMDVVKNYLVTACDWVNNGSKTVSVYSRSITVDDNMITDLNDKVGGYGFYYDKENGADVYPSSFNDMPPNDFLSRDYSRVITSSKSIYKEMPKPKHMNYLPNRYVEWDAGCWMVDVEVPKHKLTKDIVSANPVWRLPRDNRVCISFTNSPAKIVKTGHLGVLCKGKDRMSGLSSDVPNGPHIQLFTLDDDEGVLKYFLCYRNGTFHFTGGDAYIKNGFGVYNVRMSDKGKNLLGVIEKFGGLEESFDFIKSIVWRDIISESRDASGDERVSTCNKLFGYVPRSKEFNEFVKNRYHLKDSRGGGRVIRARFDDSLEYLIKAQVVHRVYQWKCQYCGNDDKLSIALMKEVNRCSVCGKEHLIPLDFKFKYWVDGFVYKTLVKHSGMQTLWTIGYLEERTMSGNMTFLTETDIYWSETEKNELDVLAIIDGELIAGEAKHSAAQITEEDGAGDAFVKVVSALQPDRIILSFYQYCDNESDVDSVKDRLSAYIEQLKSVSCSVVEVFITSETGDQQVLVADSGYYGLRTFDAIQQCR